jgi:hypothetical protein
MIPCSQPAVGIPCRVKKNPVDNGTFEEQNKNIREQESQDD